MEQESVVGEEHGVCFLLDLLASHCDVEARRELDGTPDVFVVHVDYAVFWEVEVSEVAGIAGPEVEARYRLR